MKKCQGSGTKRRRYGSTEGAPRDMGPPRRTAREVIGAIEPALEMLQFRSSEFNVCGESLAMPIAEANDSAAAVEQG